MHMEPEEYAIMDTLQRTNWWYRGRRFVVRALFKKFARTHGTFLDIGCGTGEGMRIVGESATLEGMDTSDEALALAKNKGYAALHKGSAECLPFKDDCFDGILMLDVLEHVDDDRAALRECRRVLRESGVAILTVPAYPWLWSGHDEIFGHRRRYTKAALLQAAEEAGFTIIFSSYVVSLLLPAVILYRLTERKVRNARRSHFFPLPRMLNAALHGVLCFEGILLRAGFSLPTGSSIVLVARNKKAWLKKIRGARSSAPA